MVVFAVHLDLAFRCIEGDTVCCSLDLVHIERLGLLDHALPQVHRCVRRFHRVGGGAIGSVARLEVLHERLVLRIVQRLVVVPSSELVLDVVNADSGNLFLGDRHGNHRRGGGFQAGSLVFLEECDVGITVQRVHHRIRAGELELVDDGGEVGGAHWGIFLADHFHAIALGVRLDHAICGLREHIIGANQEQLLVALLLKVIKRRHNLLVRCSTRVEDVRAGFHALVLQRVEQQRVIRLEHRQHGLTRRGRPAAEHRGHAFLFDEGLGFFGEHSRLGLAVLLHYLELLAQHAALCVNLINGHV